MIVPGKTEKDLAKFAQAHLDAANGGTNALGKRLVTLRPGETSTLVDDQLCTEGALIAPVPTTENAARAVVWLVETHRGGFTWGHDSNLAVDRTFRYEVRRP